MLKQQLDTPWKRVAFLLLLATTVLFMSAALLPLPFEIQHEEGWRDSLPGEPHERTIKRVTSSCADAAIGGKPFAHEYWILASAGNKANPYMEIVTQMMLEKDERPTQVDIFDEDLKIINISLASAQKSCVRMFCATELTAPLLQRVMSSCGASVTQARYSKRAFSWNEGQLEQRLPLLLTLSGLVAILSCLSFLYAQTIGRLVSWVRNG